jgi:MarR family transcriptional regulator for hemolysin
MLTNHVFVKSDLDAFGPLLHGTARAWRLKLDERLKPMGLSQAKWRTLTQSEIAARLGIEEPTLVTLLHRLEDDGWVTRKNAAHDRRCKTVHLARRAQRVITQISAEAFKLRHELLDDIPVSDLRTCMRVLTKICQKAERRNGINERRNAAPHVHVGGNGRH